MLKGEQLLAKWEILGLLLLREPRCRSIHAQVAWVLLERYYHDMGKAVAAVSFLAAATGLTRGSVATATADLVAWGYFTRTLGGGRRSTTYVPNWGVLGVLPLPDDKSKSRSVLRLPYGTVLQPQDASADSVLPLPEESHLPHPSKDAVMVKGIDKVPAVVASPPPALAPGGAGGAPAGFDELWRRYGVKFDRTEAEEAFATLNPDAAVLNEMLASADHWRAEYDANGVETRWRIRLPRWIARRKYLEDPPPPYDPSTPKRRRSDAKPARQAVIASQSTIARIVDSSDFESEGGEGVSFALEWLDGHEVGERFERKYQLHADRPAIESLVRATGRQDVTNSEELHGAEVRVIRKAGGVRFEAVTGGATAVAVAGEVANA